MSLLDTASLILTPNGYKASKLYSVKPTSGLGDMTVVRATTATRVNSAGLIEIVAINVPRLDYTGGGCPSILVEPLRTNLVLRSEQFDNVYWDKFAGGVASAPVVTPNVETAPDGTTTADRVVFNLNGGTLGTDISQLGSANFSSVSITRTQSFYIKTTDGTTKVFSFISPIGTLTAITVTSVYQRFTLTSTGINVGQIRLRLRGSAAGEGTSTTASIAIWGAQYEDGSNATSYIPTVASTVTRVADVISKTGISSLIGQTEGTLYAEVIIKNTENQICASIQRDGGINYIFIAQLNNKRQFSLRANNVTIFNYNVGVFLSGTNKVALVYNTNGNISAFLNGVKVSTLSTSAFAFSNTLDSLQIFDDGYYSSQNTINNKSTILFKTALTDGQAISLTTL